MALIDLLNSEARAELDQALASQTQSLLFCASEQSELDLSLTYLQNKITAQKDELFIIKPDDTGKIKIDAIRTILQKTIVSPQTRRFFLILNAETMLVGAQNALLKELEEPKANFFFWLFSKQPNQLLPTIRSRVRKINLVPIDQSAIKNYFRQALPALKPNQIKQIAFLAGNDIALWENLSTDEAELKNWAKLAILAKQIIATNSLYQKIRLIYQVPNQRDEAINFVKLVLKIYNQILQTKTTPNLVEQIEKWLEALDKITANGAVRLSLVTAVL